MTLAVFDIKRVVEDGHVIEPKAEYTGGTIRSVFSHMPCSRVPIPLTAIPNPSSAQSNHARLKLRHLSSVPRIIEAAPFHEMRRPQRSQSNPLEINVLITFLLSSATSVPKDCPYIRANKKTTGDPT